MSNPEDRAALPTNRSMPPGSIIPELAYPDVREAAAWLCRAFGFAERLRIGGHRIQLTYGAGAIVVVEGSAESAASSSHRIMVRVEDAIRHYEQAKAAGARVGPQPQDHPYGERQYNAEDLGGHRWTFSQTIADSDPAEWGGELVG
jgi:uncharacterized glyoxalase superfamily protein PhnB